MKVGVISDTHIAASGFRKIGTRIINNIRDDLDSLKAKLERYFKGVDAVFHAGDLVDLSVIEMLADFGQVYAVSGNMDPGEVKSKLPGKQIIELSGFRLGLTHGWGSPHDLSERVREQFAGDKLHCIIFGHSHHPYNQIEQGILMFNPGSATDRRFAPCRTVGILHLEEKIRGEHIEFD